MKKLLFTLVLLTTTISAYSQLLDWNGTLNKANAFSLKGDANGDGEVDISDVVFVVNIILSGDSYQESCDINYDGNVDISDVVELVNIILNGNQTTLCPDENHPHMIDLGLPSGTKWACCNVGATKPEAYGGYYAWGETEEKNDYSAYTYKYFTDSPSSYQYLGTCICGTKYDVAQMKWGDIWRMPTLEEQVELVNNCSWTRINYKGVEGCLATGLNGNRIFLPLAGFYAGTENEYIGNACRYWSGTLDLYTPYGDNNLNHCFSAYDILITNGPYDGANNRTNGEQIRPVAP